MVYTIHLKGFDFGRMPLQEWNTHFEREKSKEKYISIEREKERGKVRDLIKESSHFKCTLYHFMLLLFSFFFVVKNGDAVSYAYTEAAC